MRDIRSIRVNDRIKIPEVRLIDVDGSQIGIVPTSEALRIANEKGLDLVEVSPDAKPPVCRIMDFGKYKYQLEKKEKEAKKKQKEIEVKEFKLGFNISDYDYSYRKEHMIEILKEGNKVKVTIVFKGRQIAFKDKGYELLERIRNDLNDWAVVEKEPKLEGRILFAVFAPKRK
ncbi:MAG: translation initiation factor IF-3 [Spirochaetia bacterium]|nr:translation initiation factor IF-3 [Spirochaetota bacterium]MCX8096834.1 translation initiation factor IF-3 [Spirochaetota bacterium]MDW8112803.1 translation initiation factor IF-3 [Spirochaetia bacterium]